MGLLPREFRTPKDAREHEQLMNEKRGQSSSWLGMALDVSDAKRLARGVYIELDQPQPRVTSRREPQDIGCAHSVRKPGRLD